MKKLISAILAIAILAALGASASFAEVRRTRLEKPKNVRWEGRVLKWDPVDGAFGYRIEAAKILEGEPNAGKDHIFISYEYSKEPTFDLGDVIASNGKGTYFAAVTAISAEESNSPEAYSSLTTIEDGDFRLSSPGFSVEWTIADNGDQLLTWRDPAVDEGVDYFIRLTVYKDGAPQRTFDVASVVCEYDFTASGDIPMYSESEYYVTGKTCAAPGVTGFIESRESRSSAIVPARYMPRRLYDVSPVPVRTGDVGMTFDASYSGVYGDVTGVCLALTVTDRGGAVVKETDGGAFLIPADYRTGYGKRIAFGDVGYTFAEGDLVSWRLYLEGCEDVPEACASGEMTVADPEKHTVTFDMNGQADNFVMLVDDRACLYDIINPQTDEDFDYEPVTKEFRPTADGLSFAGWSFEHTEIGTLAESVKKTFLVCEDTVVYAMWSYVVTDFVLNIEPPVCGTEIGLEAGTEGDEDDWYFVRQSNAPVITVPEDAPYRPKAQERRSVSDRTRDAAWTDPKTNLSVIGTINGGDEYTVRVLLSMEDAGYVSGKNIDELTVTGNCAGYTVERISDYVIVNVTVKAAHDVKAGTVTALAKDGKPGEITGYCAHCGVKAAVKVDHTPGDVTGDGKINARDVTAMMKNILRPDAAALDAAEADMTGDGKLNARDVTTLMKLLVAR